MKPVRQNYGVKDDEKGCSQGSVPTPGSTPAPLLSFAWTWTAAHTVCTMAAFSHEWFHFLLPWEQQRVIVLCYLSWVSFPTAPQKFIHMSVEPNWSSKLFSPLSFQSGGRKQTTEDHPFPRHVSKHKKGLAKVFVIGYMVEKGIEEETGILEEAREQYAKILGAPCLKQV